VDLSAASEPFTDSISAFFFLLKVTPQLLARLARVLVAVMEVRAAWLTLPWADELAASGDVFGI